MASYVRTTDAPLLPPPVTSAGIIGWLRQKLFYSVSSTISTLLLGALAFWVISTLLQWAIFKSVWNAPDRELCNAEGAGACWPFVKSKIMQWIYGFYPIDQRWRVNWVYALSAISLAGLLIPKLPYKGWNALLFFIIIPIFSFVMLRGGSFGLSRVDTDQWGGLLVSLVLATVGIVASLPLGIALALGRQSDMPIIRTLSIAFIETVRGVPLITVLFMSSVMFPLFMPPGVNFDKLLKCMIGVALFSAAYMAEEVRGGLQAMPKGQYEAANSLGLSYWKSMRLIILPQSLKIVIPGIVNNFIGLFKDTSLVYIIGIFDLLNMVTAGFNDPNWASNQTGNTGYFTLAVIYFVFCFAMSRYSLFVERRLNTDNKR